MYPTIYLCIYLLKYISIYPTIYLSNNISFQLSIYSTFYLFNFLSIQLSIYTAFYLSNNLAMLPFFYLRFHLSIYATIYLYNFLSIYLIKRLYLGRHMQRRKSILSLRGNRSSALQHHLNHIIMPAAGSAVQRR